MKVVPFEPVDLGPEASGGPAECSGGFGSHAWLLAIETGYITLESGCEACNDLLVQLGLDADALELDWIPVEVVFDPECDNLGGWHGDSRCECGWTYRINPKQQSTHDQNELDRLRDVVWNDGDPWESVECGPFGTSDFLCNVCGGYDASKDNHLDGCAWLAEDQRRADTQS